MAIDGEKLKQLRLAEGISQEKLAAMCNVNKRTIQRAERGDSVALETAAFIAEAMDVPLASIRGAQLDLLETPQKQSGEVVLIPIASGRKIVDTMRHSYETEVLFEVEPTRALIEPLTDLARVLDLFKVDPWKPPHEKHEPSYSEMLEKQADLNEAINSLSELGVSIFMGTYEVLVQPPTYNIDEGMMLYYPDRTPWSYEVKTLVVVSDRMVSHFIRRPKDMAEEIPF
jgi:transcriptional regulator with XRE-family HTH domain